MMNKNTTNKQFIHGDFDKDGVPNIDDSYPFDPNRKARVNKEVSMSKLFKYVDDRRAKAEPYAKRLEKKFIDHQFLLNYLFQVTFERL